MKSEVKSKVKSKVGGPLGMSKALSGYFPCGLLDGRPLGKSSSLSGYFPSGLLELPGYLSSGGQDWTPLGK